MANHKSAKKRILTNEKSRLRNKSSISKIKTLTKNVLSATSKDSAAEPLKTAVAFIDKSVSKNVLHKNTASRKKSALAKFVNTLS